MGDVFQIIIFSQQFIIYDIPGFIVDEYPDFSNLLHELVGYYSSRFERDAFEETILGSTGFFP